MAIKLKQYLENSWYRGASQDRQTGYAAQFQYGEGINIRDMKNGVCLAGGKTESGITKTDKFIYFVSNGGLYIFTDGGQIIDTYDGTVKCTVSISGGAAGLFAVEFGDYIFVANRLKIYQINKSTWVATDVSQNSMPSVTCMLNYANTFLLFGCFNELWKMDLTLGSPTFTQIREFKSGYQIYGLTQEGNYLKIYTSNNVDTKIHYAKGTFDVEDTGLIQTVTFKGMALTAGCVTYDQGVDYVLFTIGNDCKLAKISGYNKIDIKWTQTWGGEKIFKPSSNGFLPFITACDGVLFISMDEGIWTFTEYNGWLWGGCVEFPRESSEYITHIFRYKEELWVCSSNSNGTSFSANYYDLSFHPSTYQPSGFIIGRVFDGGCAGLFKKNDQATITYNMPEGTQMELSYRYDRSSFSYDKVNFLSIKKLTDINNCYDIVVPTTPSTTAGSVLLKEDGDQILLENGNGIELEDLMICPFNKTWNLLEYRFDLQTADTTKTPILFEHSLTYYDYMRKYR